jgi:hypothetical protein
MLSSCKPETAIDLSVLENSKTLTELEIRYSNINSSTFPSLPSLEKLHIWNSFGTLVELPKLKNLEKIKILNVYDVNVDFSTWASFPSLEELSISNWEQKTPIKLPKLENLKKVKITDTANIDFSTIPSSVEFKTD